MAFSKKDFLLKARERFQKQQKHTTGGIQFISHAQYKMRQYGLSEQRVKRVIRNPKRTEEGIAKNTIAVMQPGSTVKKDAHGREIWSQEIWVMYQPYKSTSIINHQNPIIEKIRNLKLNQSQCLRVISAWRYPGVSPKRNPVPEEILREIEEGSIFEGEPI